MENGLEACPIYCTAAFPLTAAYGVLQDGWRPRLLGSWVKLLLELFGAASQHQLVAALK